MMTSVCLVLLSGAFRSPPVGVIPLPLLAVVKVNEVAVRSAPVISVADGCNVRALRVTAVVSRHIVTPHRARPNMGPVLLLGVLKTAKHVCYKALRAIMIALNNVYHNQTIYIVLKIRIVHTGLRQAGVATGSKLGCLQEHKREATGKTDLLPFEVQE